MTRPVAYVQVADIKARLDALVAAGASIAQEITDVGGGNLIASVKDADGNVLYRRAGDPSATSSAALRRLSMASSTKIGGVFCCASNRAAGNATGLATSRQQPQLPVLAETLSRHASTIQGTGQT